MPTRSAARLSGLLIPLLLSACLSAPQNPQGAGGGAGVSPVLGAPGIFLEECVGLRLSLLTPDPDRGNHVPREFEPEGGPTLSAGFGLDYLSCPRAVVFNTTRPSSEILWTWAAVGPRNASWSVPSAHSFYTYDILATDPAVADALTALGMPGRLAQVFSGSPLPIAGRSERRVFEAEDTRIAFEWVPVPGIASAEPKLELLRHHWAPNPFGFTRLQALERDTFAIHDAQTPGQVSASGGAFAPSGTGLPGAAFGMFLPKVTWEISGESAAFTESVE